MATKTWKLGERCAGGILKATIKGKIVEIKNQYWDTKEDLTIETFHVNDEYAYSNMMGFLCRLTSWGLAQRTMDWIESKIKIEEIPIWARS